MKINMKYEYYIPYDCASLIFLINNKFYFFFSGKFASGLMFSAELFLVIHTSNVSIIYVICRFF